MKILGFGNCGIDYYIDAQMAYPGGNVLNVAAAASELGAQTAFLGTIGTDEFACQIIASAKELGIDLSHCPRKEGNSSRAAIRIENGERTFADGFFSGHGIGSRFPPMLSQADLDYIRGFELVHACAYSHVEEPFSRLRGLGPLLSFDFSCEREFRSEGYLKRICPGLDLALFSCADCSESQITRLVAGARGYGARSVLITMGDRGQRFYAGQKTYCGGAVPIEPVDTMGAGDAFCAAFLCGLLGRGWSRETPPDETMVPPALQEAAEFAARRCLIRGSFGHGFPCRLKAAQSAR